MAEFLGIVENGKFKILEPVEHCCAVRLTKLIKPSLPDESAIETHKTDLSEDEGKAILVEGTIDKEELWMYEAKVIDRAGPILSATVRKTFGG